MSYHWQVWSDKGSDPWVVEVLRWKCRIPFRAVPALSKDPIPYPSYSPLSIRGKALDDWLIQVSSHSLVLQALDAVLGLCQSLGIVVNWEKSHLEPSQRMVYLGVFLDSVSFRASPAQKSQEAFLNW